MKQGKRYFPHVHWRSFFRKPILGVEFFCFFRLAAAFLCFIVGLFFTSGSIAQMIFMLLCFLLSAYDTVMKAVEDITVHHVFSTELLVLLSSLSAFAVRLELDGAAVMFLFRVCSLALDYAVTHSEKMMHDAVDSRPNTVTILEDDEIMERDREEICPGDTVIVKAGSTAAIDSLVIEGRASIDCFALCGTHTVTTISEGDTLFAGVRLIRGELVTEALGPSSGSMLGQYLEYEPQDSLVNEKLERFFTLYRRFSAPLALAVGAIITVLLNLTGKCSVSNAIHRALCVLMLMNPLCMAAALSATEYAGFLGALSRGVIFKKNRAIGKLASSSVVVLEKDGILTSGKYHVEEIHTQKLDSDTLLKAAAHAAANANTPLAAAIVDAYAGTSSSAELDYSIISNFVEYPDGISVAMKGIPVLLGKQSFLLEKGVELSVDAESPLELHVAIADRYAGSILLAETPCGAVQNAVEGLYDLGCKEVVFLSAESTEKTRNLSLLCGIEKYYSNCGSTEKVSRIGEIRSHFSKENAIYLWGTQCDSACVDASDLAVAVGDLNTPGAEYAHVLLSGGDLSFLCEAIRSAHLIRKVFWQGFGAIAAVKLLLVLFAISGISCQLWFDVLIDFCVGIAAVLNAVRAFPAQS